MTRGLNHVLMIVFTFLLIFISKPVYSQCAPPTLVQVIDSKTDSISLSWIFFSEAEGWELELVPLGNSPTLEPSTPIILDKNYSFGNLEPATGYTVFIRTVCDENIYSEWNPVNVRTLIPQPSPCLFTLPIKNNNCSQGLESFDILVEGVNGNLGDNLFLSSIDMILGHTWPADLDIRLLSPSGKEVMLSQNNGTVTDDYGDILDNDCDNFTRFSDLACVAIEDAAPPFIGSFLPESPIYNVEDGSAANGIWKLQICDRSSQDIGNLKYINLNFEPLLCELPRDILVKSINATTVEVIWTSFEGCTGTEIDLSFAGEEPGSINTTIINCSAGSIILEDLQPGTDYEIYVLSNCSGVKSPLSCSFNFTTACTEVTTVESFDQKNICTPGCSFTCDLDSYWFNIDEDDQDWLVWNQETDTDNTGPRSGVFGGGNFIYLESSPDICSPKAKSTLQSTCIEIISNEEECDLSFWYYMFGEDMGKLSLLSYANESEIADTLFSINGNQGDRWINQILSLKEYDKQAVTFKFEGTTGDGPRSDIAIDQIEFRGSIARPQGLRYYQDIDTDGYGNIDFPVDLCTTQPSPLFVINSEDCNDNDESINPIASEISCNNIDENCNGGEDDNPIGESITYTIQVVNDNCSNKGSGSINLDVLTGNTPYTFLWNTGDTTQNLNSLSAGNYICSITHATECTIETELIIVAEISDINVSIIDIEMATCDGKLDGKIQVRGENGIAPYTFYWVDQGVNNGGTLSDISAGVYRVEATDATGCSSDTIDIEIFADGMINGDVSFQLDVRCYGDSSGIIRVDAISGTPPFSYVWDIGDSTQTIEDIAAGLYECTITDAVGCQAVVSGNLQEPDSLISIIISQENIDCFGDKTGSIKTNIQGGTAPYTFAWNTGQQIDDIFDLAKGDYRLTITDANACTIVSDPVRLTEPEKLTVTLDSALAAECILSEDGYISVKAAGGIEKYNYFWSSLSKDTFALENISAGVYSLTITDQNNCKATFSNYELKATSTPIQIGLSAEQHNICADDSIALIVATISQGHKPIDYNWSAGVNNISDSLQDSLGMLPPGKYTVSVTDVEGCIGISDTLVIDEISPIEFTIAERVDNICFDDSIGRIRIAALNGTPPYSYLWSNGDTTLNIENLQTGKYKVTISDANDCSITSQNISINSRPAFEIDVDITNATGTNDDGSIALSIEGGTPPYSIDWLDGIAMDDELIAENLISGEYNILITDDISCDTTFIVNVDMSNNTKNTIIEDITIFPNPVLSALQISSDINIYNIEIIGVDGKATVFTTLQSQNNIMVDMKPFQNGIYILKLTTKKGVTCKIVNKS